MASTKLSRNVLASALTAAVTTCVGVARWYLNKECTQTLCLPIHMHTDTATQTFSRHTSTNCVTVRVGSYPTRFC